MAKTGSELNVDLLLKQAVTDLERLRDRLMHDTYFATRAARDKPFSQASRTSSMAAGSSTKEVPPE